MVTVGNNYSFTDITSVVGTVMKKVTGVDLRSSFMTCDRVCNKSNIASLTIVTGSAYRSRAPGSFSVV